MGGKNVKNTIVQRLLELIAPDLCCGCGKVGSLLCHNCKNDIISEPFVGCFMCGRTERRGICDDHLYTDCVSRVVSARSGTFEALINAYKFHNSVSAARVLAELLDESLPYFPLDARIITIPTAYSHIRKRGYDHIDLLARHFASMRKLTVSRVLTRSKQHTQHTVNRQGRFLQSEGMFALKDQSFLTGTSPIILLDDVITTGATISAALECLSGTKAPIIVVALAYQEMK